MIGPGLVHRLAADLQRRFVVEARIAAETGVGETQKRRLAPERRGPARRDTSIRRTGPGSASRYMMNGRHREA